MPGSAPFETDIRALARDDKHRAPNDGGPEEEAKLVCADLLRPSSFIDDAHGDRPTPRGHAAGLDRRDRGHAEAAPAQARFDRREWEPRRPLLVRPVERIGVGHSAQVRMRGPPHVLAVFGVAARVRMVGGEDRLAPEGDHHAPGRVHRRGRAGILAGDPQVHLRVGGGAECVSLPRILPP